MEKYSATDFSGQYGAVLLDFMSDMHAWEVLYYRKRIEAFTSDVSFLELEDSMRADLSRIFEKYVVAAPRNNDRLENLVCGQNPEYDPGTDKIEPLSYDTKKALVVIKKSTGLRASFRLTLVVQDGICKIGSRELQNGQKWERTYI